MNNEIKVNLNVVLQGRIMLSQVAAEKCQEGCYDSFSLVVSDTKGKRETITVTTRKSVPATQFVNICKDAYYSMISEEIPRWAKPKWWLNINHKMRLEAHLQRISEGLGGVSYSYQVFED